MQHRAGSLAAPVASFSHAYNAIGDLASRTELTNSKTFAHDSNARLTGVTQTSPAPAAQVESYTYDPAGNRIAFRAHRFRSRISRPCGSGLAFAVGSRGPDVSQQCDKLLQRPGDRLRRYRAIPLRGKIGRSDRGFALVVVIWAIGLIGLLVLSYLSAARLRLRAAANIASAARAEALAEAAVATAILELESAGGPTGAARPPFDGTPRFCALPQGVAAVAIENEAGKIDLNASSANFLARALTAIEMTKDDATRLAGSIVSYRSARTNSLSAEDGAYSADGRPFGPRKALFQSIFELDQVLGVTPEQMQFLRPFITVHSFLPEPDLSVAPPALFAALTGAASDEVARLKDRPFPNTLDRRGYPARGGTVAAVLVHVEARTADGATFVREALLTARGDMPGGAQSIKEWRGGRSRFGAELMELERQGLSIPSC